MNAAAMSNRHRGAIFWPATFADHRAAAHIPDLAPLDWHPVLRTPLPDVWESDSEMAWIEYDNAQRAQDTKETT